MHKQTILLLTLLALAGCSTDPAQKQAAKPAEPAVPPIRETTFEGYLNTGISLVGDSGGSILLFLDSTQNLAAESKTPAALLDNLAANPANLRDGLNYSVALLPETVQSVEKKPVREFVFLTAYPMADFELPAGTKTKGKLVRAQAGKLTRLADVVAAHGPELERQTWKGAAFADLAMEGVAYWWGNTGVKTAADGAITHVLLRGKPEAAKK